MPSVCVSRTPRRRGSISSRTSATPGARIRVQQRVHGSGRQLAGPSRPLRLPRRDVRGLDHDLAYRAIASDEIAATDLYSTDAEIGPTSSACLRDDLEFFSFVRMCLALSRRSATRGRPGVSRRWNDWRDGSRAAAMAGMNAAAKIDRVPEDRVAAHFLEPMKFGIEA